jgi:hypothetical protein
MAAFSVLGTGSAALAFSFFVYVLPIYYILSHRFEGKVSLWYNARGKIFGKLRLHEGAAA